MSKHEDLANDVLERLEYSDSKQDATPQSKARAVTRRTALAASGGALGAFMLGSNAQAFASGHDASVSSIFGSQKAYHFVFVNHVTTNPFFTPTQYGIADACSLLGCTYQWTGSQTGVVAQMVTAFNTAITAGADGIACPFIDPTAFNAPTANALAKGIPVLSYNADEPNTRLAYIGQDLLVSGQQMGLKIKSLMPSGGDIAIFISQPGAANVQPRLTGAQQELAGTNIKVKSVDAGAVTAAGLTVIQSFWTSHTSYKGLFAVDGGDTQSVGQTVQKYGLAAKGVKSGGFDLTPISQTELASGNLEFTIDQQPYLQGFIPVLEFFLYHASDGLSGIADVDTGLKFLNKTTVAPYNNTKSRYEGTSSKAGVTKA
jgi:simple sugar transport system substrate-binding protein